MAIRRIVTWGFIIWHSGEPALICDQQVSGSVPLPGSRARQLRGLHFPHLRPAIRLHHE